MDSDNSRSLLGWRKVAGTPPPAANSWSLGNLSSLPAGHLYHMGLM